MNHARREEPIVGLALSGGGALGIAHVGAVQALHDKHIPVHCVAGTSAGAIVAASVAFGIPLQEVAEEARRISWRSISRPAMSKLGLLRHSALRAVLTPHFEGKVIEDAQIPLAIVATDLVGAEKVVLRSGSVVEALLASTCLPGFFAPLAQGERLLVDGGVSLNFPVEVLEEIGATIKIGVNVNRWIAPGAPRSLFGVVSKSLAIMNAHPHLPRPDEIFIEPRLEHYSVSDFAKADRLMGEGYREAALRADDILLMLERARVRPGFTARLRRILTSKI